MGRAAMDGSLSAPARGAARFHPRLKKTVTPCVTCGKPVVWMAQHRECWRWEKANGIGALSAVAARIEKARRRGKISAAGHSPDVEMVQEMPAAPSALEVDCSAYAASHA